ncbi:plasma membrane ascorbate-dependent reductase CYBRD1 isoform X2 [Diprion similis]|uniref:plasma membrane ascorbate-dependent reductase CYBRD1 isoform X2 n=1 Tax=Diprion similis TaxID=362088 RepID=UPI001EF788D6|nr:plasma membrane ascorbate-dependent reductase CYBRD1 isoform X2 [Diprion similis]
MPSDYPYEYETLQSNDMDQQPNQQTQAQLLEGFNMLFGVTELVGIFLIILVTVWVTHFRGGFAWTSDPGLEFNWHPLLMTIGLVFLYSNGMLIYRTQRTVRKRRLKLVHAGIMIFCLLCTIIGLIAAFDSHNLANPPKPNMYTLHSWVGLTSVILFCCQWVAGMVSFLYPTIQPHLREAYMPLHVYFGTAGFVGVIAACLIGLNEKAIWALQSSYSKFTDEAILINIIGLVFIIFGGLSVYMVSQNRYKRLPRPEDEVLLTERSN